MDQIVPIFTGVEGAGRHNKTIGTHALGFVSKIRGARRCSFGQVNVGFTGEHIQRRPPGPERCVLRGDLEIKIAAVRSLVCIDLCSKVS